MINETIEPIIQVNDIWLEEAIETLSHYNMIPFIDPFLDSNGLEKPDTREEKLELIKTNILNGKLSFEKLVSYLDQIKMYGKQNIFVFILSPNHIDYLHKIRNPNVIKEKLSQANCEYAWNNTHIVWDSESPYLTNVFYRNNGKNNELVFQWVYTRNYQVLTGTVLKVQKERAVSFFIIDTEDGTARLNIQTLPPRPRHNLHEEFDALKKEIARFIDLNYFSPLSLSPLIKRFLGKPALPITVWQIEYAGTGTVKGQRNPSILFKLGLPFKHFYSKEITLYWKVDQVSHGKPRLYFTLNGESDCINFNAITDADKINYILEQLKQLSLDVIEMKELKLSASENPEYSRIISMIDFHFSNLKEIKLEIKHLSSEVWASESDINNVFNILVEKFPHLFYLEKNNHVSLCMYNRFGISGGAQEFLKRGSEKLRRKELLKAITTPSLSIVLILPFFEKEALGWVVEKFSQAFFKIDLIILKIILIVILAILSFGTRTLFHRIPEIVFSILSQVNLISDENLLSLRFGEGYQPAVKTPPKGIIFLLEKTWRCIKQKISRKSNK